MALPEKTIYTPLGETEDVKAQLENCNPPRTRNRIQPFIVFLKKQYNGPMGEGGVTERPFVFDLSTQGDTAMIRHYVVNKKWPILAYRLTESFIPQGSESTWDDKPAMFHIRGEIEALSGGNRRVVEKQKQQISALEDKVKELERTTTKKTSSNSKSAAKPVQKTAPTTEGS